MIGKAVKQMKWHAEVWGEDGESIGIAPRAQEIKIRGCLIMWDLKPYCYWDMCNQSSCCSCWTEASQSALLDRVVKCSQISERFKISTMDSDCTASQTPSSDTEDTVMVEIPAWDVFLFTTVSVIHSVMSIIS